MGFFFGDLGEFLRGILGEDLELLWEANFPVGLKTLRCESREFVSFFEGDALGFTKGCFEGDLLIDSLLEEILSVDNLGDFGSSIDAEWCLLFFFFLGLLRGTIWAISLDGGLGERTVASVFCLFEGSGQPSRTSSAKVNSFLLSLFFFFFFIERFILLSLFAIMKVWEWTKLQAF